MDVIAFEYSSPTQKIYKGSFVGTLMETKHPKTAPNSVIDDVLDIQPYLKNLITTGVIKPTVNTYIGIHFAPSLVIKHKTQTSCIHFCDVSILAYGIIPDFSSGGCAGIACGYGSVFENQCATASHELEEAITNPAIGTAKGLRPPLVLLSDLCANTNQMERVKDSTTGKTWALQKIWSNAQQACVVRNVNNANPAQNRTTTTSTSSTTSTKTTTTSTSTSTSTSTKTTTTGTTSTSTTKTTTTSAKKTAASTITTSTSTSTTTTSSKTSTTTKTTTTRTTTTNTSTTKTTTTKTTTTKTATTSTSTTTRTTSSTTVSRKGKAQAELSISASKQITAPGEAVSFEWLNADPENVDDWVVFSLDSNPGSPPSGANNMSTNWAYTYGGYTALHKAPTSSGIITLNAPESPGVWTLYYCLNDGFLCPASVSITVVAPLTITASSLFVAPGEAVGFTWKNANTSDVDDWVVFSLTPNPGGPPTGGTNMSTNWGYTYGGYSSLHQSPPSSGTTTLHAPSSPGVWTIYYCLNDGYDCPANVSITVVAPTLSAASQTIESGKPISISWTDASSKDFDDWLVFALEEESPSRDNLDSNWQYTYGGQEILNRAPENSGTLDLIAPTTAGDWRVYYCHNNGYECPSSIKISVV
ncbi:hypothetical protein BDR26DRAFT_852870 [Obelidium mucronatum]|nr:hypothetical protein BDR26DRAFT_852870 [Obelidium mucronatum]